MSRILIYRAIILLAVMILPSCGNDKKPSEPEQENNVYSNELDLAVTFVKSNHPDPFTKISEDDFDAEVEETRAELAGLSQLEAALEFYRLIALIGDSHTTISFSGTPDANFFPLICTWFDDGLYATDVPSNLQHVLGKKITGINGHSFEEVKTRLAQYISHENEEQIKKQLPIFIVLSDALKRNGIITEGSSAEFTFEGMGSVNVEAIHTSLLASTTFVNLRAINNSEPPLFEKNPNDYYWFEYLEEEKTVYFKYNQCRIVSEAHYNNFLASLYDTMENNEIEKLIIDLRNNGGGSSTYFKRFLSDMTYRKWHGLNDRSKLFTLINRVTFSSGLMAALDMKYETNSLLLGEPTSAKPAHFGEIKSRNLHTINAMLSSSTKYFNNYGLDTPSLNPDILIPLTIEDYKEGHDPVLEYIFSHY